MDGILDSAADELERLWRHVRRRVASPHAAEDIVQETVLAFYSRWSLAQPIGNAMAWLLAVATNKVVDHYRRTERRPASLNAPAAGEDAGASELWELVDAPVATPAEEAERTELRAALVAAIRALPPEQGEAFVATELHGLTYRELAERTGVPINTLLSRKRYAVLKLRRALSEFWETG
ncbi:MAG: RNA polymerase sigma factor [Planctomycetota bacterium]|jgi:RNA polymerase sigma factor (sigma-70 family)